SRVDGRGCGMTKPITIRKAFDLHYHKDELGPRSHYPFLAAFKAWEKFTDNPSIPDITNATVEAFRNAAIETGLAPYTINNYWGHLRSVFRRVGPPMERSPWALDLFPGWRIPAMRPV